MMKTLALTVLVICTFFRAVGQGKYFEGDIQYKVSVKSLLDNMSDKDVARILAVGELLTVSFKDGSYRRSDAAQDEYYIGKEQKVYIKFKKLDTLYYMDYSFDTTALPNVMKADSIFNINQYPCKVITLNSPANLSRYYYSPDLVSNPIYDTSNTIGHFNIYARETKGAIYLWKRAVYSLAVKTDSCMRVERKSIDEKIFDLPALPVKKFEPRSLIVPARFQNGQKAWLKYIESNLDTKITEKYVKVPRGQQDASQTVYVEFAVNENGTISDVRVLNKSDVHSKVSEEAVRVIQESPRWIAASFYGEKLKTFVKQPIVFKVTK